MLDHADFIDELGHARPPLIAFLATEAHLSAAITLMYRVVPEGADSYERDC